MSSSQKTKWIYITSFKRCTVKVFHPINNWYFCFNNTKYVRRGHFEQTYLDFHVYYNLTSIHWVSELDLLSPENCVPNTNWGRCSATRETLQELSNVGPTTAPRILFSRVGQEYPLLGYRSSGLNSTVFELRYKIWENIGMLRNELNCHLSYGIFLILLMPLLPRNAISVTTHCRSPKS